MPHSPLTRKVIAYALLTRARLKPDCPAAHSVRLWEEAIGWAERHLPDNPLTHWMNFRFAEVLDRRGDHVRYVLNLTQLIPVAFRTGEEQAALRWFRLALQQGRGDITAQVLMKLSLDEYRRLLAGLPAREAAALQCKMAYLCAPVAASGAADAQK